YIFSVTGWLITFLAAGMAAQAVFYLDQAGYLTILNQQAWDTSGILSQDSYLGLFLHTLIGYADRPTVMQLVIYVAVIAAMMGLARYAALPRREVAIT
ncbi:MAG TPA: iron permease, partial [Bauldia sp.]|nr:iron permease [Bauldia sp.]